MKSRTLHIIIIAFLLVSCGKSERNEGKQIFRYNESAGIASLDPAFAKDQAMIWASQQLYNGLIQLDSNLDIQPAIAKSWVISDSGQTYTFTLRNDVYFHRDNLFKHGRRKVVANDFVYSFNRIVDEKLASPGRWIFDVVLVEKGKYAFWAPNDTTFVIKLKQAFSPFLGMLGMPYCSVVPHEVVDFYGTDFRQHPVGTGPFRFQKWKENVKLVLQKNPDYFEFDEKGERLPYLDAISITFIIDKQTVFLEFIKGNLDFMNSLDASYKDEILTTTGQLRPKYAGKLNMTSQPYLNTEYLGFQMEQGKSILKDKHIRQAINYGFDRRKMMKYLRNNVGTPGCFGFIPIGLQNGDINMSGYEYNPRKSKQLLAEAGYPNGKNIPALTLATTSNYLDLCKYIQQQLELIGFKINIDVNPPGALREHIAQSKVEWFRGSWIADYPDAENYLSLFYSENFCPKGPNYTHFKNTEYDELYLRAKSENNKTIRDSLYQRMNEILIDEAPVVVLYYDQILHFTHKNVSGLRSNAMNALDLRRVKKIENTKQTK